MSRRVVIIISGCVLLIAAVAYALLMNQDVKPDPEGSITVVPSGNPSQKSGSGINPEDKPNLDSERFVVGSSTSGSITVESLATRSVEPFQFVQDGGRTPAELESQLRADSSGRRDEKKEQSIKEKFFNVSYLNGTSTPLAVMCSRTICKVTGSTPAGLTEEQFESAWQELRSDELAVELRERGYRLESLRAEGEPTTPGAVAISAYLTVSR